MRGGTPARAALVVHGMPYQPANALRLLGRDRAAAWVLGLMRVALWPLC